MSQDNTPKAYSLPCGGFISTIFTYESTDVQNAANSVYVHKSTIDGQYSLANPLAPKKYVFKTDRERMQFIIGQQGTVPKATGY
jgi:hypothetical protein